MKIAVKSRRIGISWADACGSALDASAINGIDTWYLGYNREFAQQYIEDVAFWARSYQLAASEVEAVVLDDEKDILVYRVKFASGFKVSALSSNPSNLRGKKGKIVIDEAAFHEDLEGLRKSAMAILAWGGQVRFISSHNGEDNPFNLMVEATKAGEFDYSIHYIDLDDALADGLYKRICLMENHQWSFELELAWRSQLIKDYGADADEELFCKPYSLGAGKVFNRTWFQIVDSVPDTGVTVRFWDLAATAADLKKDSFYTAGVKMRFWQGCWYVLDAIAEKVSPAQGDELILATAQQDGRGVRVRWELEGGSAGKRDAVHLVGLLRGFDAAGTHPKGDKVTRAKPYASELKRGNVKLLRGGWNQQYINSLHGFDGTSKPLINDLTDASSGAYDELTPVVRRGVVGSGSWINRG